MSLEYFQPETATLVGAAGAEEVLEVAVEVVVGAALLVVTTAEEDD